MTMINVVTSCSRTGWQEYGRQFVESFVQHWPIEVGLYLVSEDDLAIDVAGLARPFTVLWMHENSERAAEFDRRHRDNPRMHGRVKMPTDAGWTPRKQDRGYNFRYDAFRFAKKVFAIEIVAKLVAGGRLFWVDADVVTFAPVPVDMLKRLLPADKALSCLDRGTSYHSECGFVGYNLDHPLGRSFIEAFADLYASDQVVGLGEWHDSWVFDWLRRRMSVPTFAIPHNSRHHPLPNSDLGYHLDHLKGARKQKGRTPSEEVLSSKKRALPYWSAAR